MRIYHAFVQPAILFATIYLIHLTNNHNINAQSTQQNAAESSNKWKEKPCSQLNIGQYKCDQPVIDDQTQSAVNCTKQNLVQVPCYPAKNIICENKVFDGETIGFYKQVTCRYVTHYQYQTAVLLSIFLGVFGIDRFYLGYVSIGILKMCTFGFMFIGYLIDMILIITQTLKPSDGSSYIVDYYGTILIPTISYNNYTYNFTYF